MSVLCPGLKPTQYKIWSYKTDDDKLDEGEPCKTACSMPRTGVRTFTEGMTPSGCRDGQCT